jgi:pyridoxal phosphate enzyme (YggS family)
MSAIDERFRQILDRVQRAAGGRPVRIIGVSKTVPSVRIREAYGAGLRAFGENRMQEALPKINELSDLELEWHFIGHLQTNKARDAAQFFSMIQSVDSQRLLLQLEAKAARPIDALIEVNLGGEASKSGIPADGLPALLAASQKLQRIRICGLMTVPPFLGDPEDVRPYFRRLRDLRDANTAQYPGLTELSMGMSHDYVVAIEEGATMVRIGSAIFGSRQ